MKGPIIETHSRGDLPVFGLVYLATWFSLMGTFVDGTQTRAMFILLAFINVISAILFILFIGFICMLANAKLTVFTKALLLFLFLELLVAAYTGNLPLWGLLQKYGYSQPIHSGNANLDADTFLFREKRDFTSSASATAGVIAMVGYSGLRKIRRGVH